MMEVDDHEVLSISPRGFQVQVQPIMRMNKGSDWAATAEKTEMDVFEPGR
jgi:hypothetical protein